MIGGWDGVGCGRRERAQSEAADQAWTRLKQTLKMLRKSCVVLNFETYVLTNNQLFGVTMLLLFIVVICITANKWRTANIKRVKRDHG